MRRKSIKLYTWQLEDLTNALHYILENHQFSTNQEQLLKEEVIDFAKRAMTRSNKLHFDGQNSGLFSVKAKEVLLLLVLGELAYFNHVTTEHSTILLKLINHRYHHAKKNTISRKKRSHKRRLF